VTDAVDATPERLIGLYRTMCRIRAFEEAAEQASERQLMLGALHVSIGQEAVAAGVCANLTPADVITSTHRGHGHALAKGLDPLAMMCELLGRADGTCGGKGGSMHLADLRLGMLGANGIVPDGLAIAVGAAHAMSLRKAEDVVVAFFGDGGVNRGPFLETLNWAANFSLRVLFVCEDNGFASTTRSRSVTAGPGPDARAAAVGVPSVRVDGNDVAAVQQIAAELIAEIRRGGEPRFLYARTYRLRGHTAGDAAGYRSDQELTDALRSDPLVIAERRLKQLGATGWDSGLASARAEMNAVLEEAAASPFPSPDRAYADVQDAGATMLQAVPHGD
jgi:acetoin:2,6-dichlorophenolindophenol oxidoreductase subunit alpha